MVQASSNRMSLRYAFSSGGDFNDSMAGGAYRVLPVNANALVHNKQTVQSQRLRADFGVHEIIEVGASGGGRLPFEFDLKNFSDILEALVGGTWSGGSPLQPAGAETGTGGTLVNGVEEKYLDIETDQQDLTNAFVHHPSWRPGQFSLTISAGALITGDITFMGRRALPAVATATGSVVAEDASPIVNATSNVGVLELDDVAVTRKIRRITLNVNHNLSALDAVGEKFAIGLNRGFLNVTGEIEFYYEDNALFTDFEAHTKRKLEIPLTDSVGNTMLITVPRIAYTGGTPEQPGVNQPARQVLPWEAEHSGSMIQFDLTLV